MMQGNKLESVETWQCAGDTFEGFEKIICSFFDWNCGRDDDKPDFHWQMNLGVLKSEDSRKTPRILMARLISNRGFLQIQGQPSDDVIIVMPVKGSLRLERDGTTKTIVTGAATIYQPRSEVRVYHAPEGESCECYIIKLSFEWVRRFLYDILQLPVEQDLQLAPVVDMTTPKARLLSRLISTLCSDAFTFQSRHLSNVLQQRLAETFSHMLLDSIPHRYSQRMDTPRAGPMPNYLRVARDFMHREARNNPSMVEVARVAAISVRTLETSFRTYMDVTPHVYLRSVRLKMAHEALKDEKETRSIADIAADFGFPHAGRFAQYYTSLFGEAPSDTRRKTSPL